MSPSPTPRTRSVHSTPAKRGTPRWGAARALAAATALVASAFWAQPASADTMIIERPGYHARYLFEAEPHALLGFVDPPGAAHGQGFGLGFRGTFNLLDKGFIPKINNSIGLGVGLDFAHYGSSDCTAYDATGQCVATDAVSDIWVPVVMQWNFFISRNWSVFGEPGVAIRFEQYDGPGDKTKFDYLHVYLGGRFHFTDNITLTLRVGYPTFSVGCSFLL